MHRKAALATAGALTATLFSGVVAVGATTGLLSAVERGGPGHERLVDQASAAPSRPGKRIVMIVDDPAPAASSSSATPSSGRRAAAPPAPAPAPVARSARPASREESEAPKPAKAPPPLPATNPPPPTTTTPGPYNCRGSDDGMTEAQKKAREAYCQGSGGDD